MVPLDNLSYCTLQTEDGHNCISYHYRKRDCLISTVG